MLHCALQTATYYATAHRLGWTRCWRGTPDRSECSESGSKLGATNAQRPGKTSTRYQKTRLANKIACGEAGLVLVAFDRATLPWHAGQVLRAGESHGGLILFRRIVRTTDHGHQARLLTDFWRDEGRAWDWSDRIVYLPKSDAKQIRDR